MIFRFLFIALLWLGSLLSYDLSYQELYPRILEYLHAHQGQMVMWVFLGSFFLVVLSFILSQVKLFAHVYHLARFAFEAGQFAIYLLSFAAVVFWFDFQRNLWSDLGLLLSALPFMVLAASCASLWIFDFNYPQHNRIGRNLVVAAVSLAIIYAAGLIG